MLSVDASFVFGSRGWTLHSSYKPRAKPSAEPFFSSRPVTSRPRQCSTSWLPPISILCPTNRSPPPPPRAYHGSPGHVTPRMWDVVGAVSAVRATFRYITITRPGNFGRSVRVPCDMCRNLGLARNSTSIFFTSTTLRRHKEEKNHNRHKRYQKSWQFP